MTEREPYKESKESIQNEVVETAREDTIFLVGHRETLVPAFPQSGFGTKIGCTKFSVCMYVCLWVYVRIWMWVWMLICVYLCVCLFLCSWMYVGPHVRACACARANCEL